MSAKAPSMNIQTLPDKLGTITTCDSADLESPSRHKRTGNFFSLVNVDYISLGIQSDGIFTATVPKGASTDSFDELSIPKQSILSHEVTCYICLQDFEETGGKRPLQLKCGHNVCFECEHTLLRMLKKKALRCPVCSLQSNAPHEINSNLLKQLTNTDIMKERRVCAECKVNKIDTFCEDCLLPLCNNCDSLVHTPKPFQKHKRSKTSFSRMGRQLLTKCRYHFQEITKYCMTCKVVLCPACVQADDMGHREHDIQAISDIIQEQRHTLQELSDGSSKVELSVEETLKSVNEGMVALGEAQQCKDFTVNSVLKTKSEINAHFDDIIHNLEMRRNTLLQQVDIITEHKLSSLKAQHKALSHMLTRSYLGACRGIITTASTSDLVVADSYAALQQHLNDILNTDMSSTAMREPVVDFLVPEFHGPIEMNIRKISQYGAVGGPRVVEGLTCSVTEVSTMVKLKWNNVQSRGHHVARSIEIHMATKRPSLLKDDHLMRMDSYEPSEDGNETETLQQQTQEYKLVGETCLTSTEYKVDVSKFEDQMLLFRVRIVDTDLNLVGPWSAEASFRTPRKFGKLLPYRTPFDPAGLVHYLGTFGTKQWCNPILSGEVIVSASSFGKSMYFSSSSGLTLSTGRTGWLTSPSKEADSSNYSSGNPPTLEQLSHLVSSSPSSTWTFCTDDAPASWVCFDIGTDRLIKLSHYCIRNGAAIFQASATTENVQANAPDSKKLGRSSSNLLSRSTSSFSKFQDGELPFSLPGSGGAYDKCATLRSWHLQGRVRERGDWVTLSVHTRVDNDLLPDVPYLSKGWPVSSKLGAYRFFRILQTGRNSTGNDVLSISGIDFYGTLF